MNVLEIVREYLQKNGYDGLFNSTYACGCEASDLAPCDGELEQCEVGYKGPCIAEECENDGDCEWHIGPVKHDAD